MSTPAIVRMFVLMPPRRGDDGYGEHCMVLIEQSRYACEGCQGMLTDQALSAGGWSFCGGCACAHKVQVIDRHRYATWVPAYGRCRVADAKLAEERPGATFVDEVKVEREDQRSAA